MFKKEINFISDLNLNKLQILGDRVTIMDIKKSNIHPSLIHYINATIDYEIFNDRKKIESDSLFNYGSDRINNYFILISEEIKRTQIFKTRDIRQILQKAIIFNINFLTKPNKTLTQHIFKDSQVKSVEEIIIGLSHAYYYQYLIKILLTYLDKKKILLMRKDEFSNLLFRIDSISKETHIDDTLSTAVNSMANFFDPQSKISAKLPLQGIILYLEEKRLNEYSLKIKDKFGADTSDLFTTTEILNELRSVTPETELEITTSRKEEELVPDNSEYSDINPEMIASNSTDEIIDLDSDNNLDDHEIFEVSEDEVEIPNNHILSDDDFSISEDSNGDTTKDVSSEKKNEEELVADITNIDAEKEEPSEIDPNNIPDDEENRNNDLKKKPNSIHLLRKLIDINSLYDSLSPESKAFDNVIFENDIAQLSIINDETNYILDQSTIKEEIEIVDNSLEIVKRNVPSDRKDQNVEENDVYKESYISDSVNEDSYDGQLEKLEKEINEVSDINSSIDDLVKDETTEAEYLAENNSMEIVDQDLIQTEDNIELKNENITLLDDDDEELTEVFTDLAFLERDEAILQESQTANTINEKNLEEVIEQDEKSNEISQNKLFSDFAEMLSSKDMTKTIEFIFDYDMEDYHNIVTQISESQNEEEALIFIENYCKNNHVDITSHEVEHFKLLISDFFTQAYS